MELEAGLEGLICGLDSDGTFQVQFSDTSALFAMVDCLLYRPRYYYNAYYCCCLLMLLFTDARGGTAVASRHDYCY